MNDTTSFQRYLGPIKLAPGVLPSQIPIFIFVVLAALCVTVFLPLMQALVFTEILHVPKPEHGRLAGNLVTTQQLAALLFFGLTGSLTDRLGRKNVLMIAITGFVACLIAYPLASTVLMLFVLQFIYGIMTTGHIVGSSTMVADYPDNSSRGKFVAMIILVQAAVSGLVVGWLGARLPGWLVNSGLEPALAGRYAFWALAGLGGIGVMVAYLFLKDPPRTGKPPARARNMKEGLQTFVKNIGLVIAAGRKNPRFGLVMLMGLVIRSDYLVMLSFVSLWVVNAATSQGIATVDALKTAGALLITFKLATAAAQVLFGFVADRINRSILLVVALTLTAFSLISTLLISDVFGTLMYVVVACIGITESALIVCGQAMLGEEAPPDLRGSATGIFYFTGTLGVVVMSFLAGFLFDKVGYAAPFVLVGALNLTFAVLGAWIVWKNPGAAPTGKFELGGH